MLENKWAREYLRGLFEANGKTVDDLREFVAASGLDDIENPLVEIAFLRRGASAFQGFGLSVAALARCGEDAPLGLIAELVETVEDCNWKLMKAEEELPNLKGAVDDDPNNGEKLAKLGFGFSALDEREAALTAFTKALEYPDTLCTYCHRDCLNNIGWDHYLHGDYEQALGWFEHACRLKDPQMRYEAHLGDYDRTETGPPYRLALENVLLTLAKMGRLTEATERLQEYHEWFGRLPSYESHALEKLGLQPDVIFIRSRTRTAVDGDRTS